MLFDDYKLPFGSDDNSSGSSNNGFNRIKNTGSVTQKKKKPNLDISDLVKFWNVPEEEENVSLSLENNFTFKSSENWDVLAEALYQEEMFSKFDEADELNDSHDIWQEESGSKCELVQSLLAEAVIARENDELAKSRMHLQQALREFLEFSHTEEQDDQEVQGLMGHIFIEMANQFLESEELLCAYRFSCHAVKLAHEIEDESLYANAVATLGVIIGLDGQLDLSFQLLSEAADRHRELEDHEGYIIDLMNLGELVSREGNWDTSATLLDQAIELSRQYECINLFLKASEIRNHVESILRVKQTDPQRN